LGWDFIQGSISFAVGFCLVLVGWAVLGMLVEVYGFFVLFRYSNLFCAMLGH
jgi:hypothetical protein